LSLKVSDRVWITDSTGMEVAEGTIINVNDFREPELKFAVDVEGYTEDVLFFGEDSLIKQEENKNE